MTSAALQAAAILQEPVFPAVFPEHVFPLIERQLRVASILIETYIQSRTTPMVVI